MTLKPIHLVGLAALGAGAWYVLRKPAAAAPSPTANPAVSAPGAPPVFALPGASPTVNPATSAPGATPTTPAPAAPTGQAAYIAAENAAAAVLAGLTPGSSGYACAQATYWRAVLGVTGEPLDGTGLDSTTARSWIAQCAAAGGS